MNDMIFLKGMKFYGYHGALAENEIGQIFSRRNFKSRLIKSGQTDNVKDTVHYGEVFEDVKDIVEGPPCNLIEHLVNVLQNV